MKKSIQVRLAVTFIGIMLCSILVIVGINSFFLEKYYTSKKVDSIEEVYNYLNRGDYEDTKNKKKLDNLCLEKNISWILVDADTLEVLQADGRNSKILYAQLLFGYVEDKSEVQCRILASKDNYVLVRIQDNATDEGYMDMWGILDNQDMFLIRTPVSSIKDSAEISNLFYAYIGTFSIILCAAVIWFISKRITRPIKELTEISRRMSDLDFEARYESGGMDEIGVLGENFNKMSDELEQTISELKTANNELQKDIERKQQIDEMRKEFLANVSHELKTPIALIQGYAEGLKECINDDAESREFYCDVIIDESAKMNNMVKKLLTLNQLEFGNDQVTMERFDLADLVKGVVQSSSLLAEQKQAAILFSQEEPVYVWGDEFKIEEVVTNYISNALNHVDGTRKIEVKMERQNGHVRFSVFNTGTPIPEEDLDKIWVKFYKVDKARTREYGGSGIGLSIVKAIMESMHQAYGVINYENGVEFWFELEEK